MLKRQGQSYTHRRSYNNSQLPGSRHLEPLTHRVRGVNMAAMDRLSINKTRVRAKVLQPDYVPKKQFGFRTINSPSNLNEATAAGSITDSKQAMPAPEGTEKHDSVENLVVPDSFLASQKVEPLINQVQHESPSGKFQTKLLKREKERQMA